ncbi:UDP-N-acetylglucosamine 1-carboxyvinyltransferase [Candidatus Methylacidithermus pantelleriae]|uniref:UDP-N-acetylglucosamine 1-carboxyvinyltransferase n=1 Tax=Candidatus Methylacidithermus pantelleriae TaxID=2744239 RepID=A0A8J2BMP7_9BACT|nr:UDP-N-acetylglucosamine 1-carboxyvinyltransferase [Candidatus Methylacidithermus pantelleriae]CAF0691351.1 UDP-N-acetylglucosamine 1-carboxyvinyltransferase [Candidatus Methylacidithermus pantelleriae]
MHKLVIHGGLPLKGKVSIGGSKNSSLPILAATLLTPEPCILHGVPNLSDIRYMLQILQFLGAEVEFSDSTVRVQARNVQPEAPYDLVRKMRASICVLGPLLARCHQAKVSLPGGCVIGDRPIDLHLKGLSALGAEIRVEEGYIVAQCKELKGAKVELYGKFGSTVLGTDNVLMAASLARGTTLIEGAAVEPEVADLVEFLQKMGATIRGAGTRVLEIEGVEELHGAEHTVIRDRIEASTFAVAAVMTGGELLLEGAPFSHMDSVLQTLRSCGARWDITPNGIRVWTNGPLRAFQLQTEPYPGFPTDMQAQFCALACVTPGRSTVEERIFPNRFMHVSELKRMGAQIELLGNRATIEGVSHLSGAPVMASDLRASAALVLAGLVAKGKTTVHRVYHIDRGYENIDQKLQQVGAEIRREVVS